MRRIRRKNSSPARDGLIAGRMARAGVRVETWVESGHRGHALLRPDARQDHRARRRLAPKRWRACGPRWPSAASTASRPTWTICDRSAMTPAFAARRHHDRLPAQLRLPAPRHRRDRAGTQTTVQDYPGRLGYWHVGVPPSGPMDELAFRAANRLVGNAECAAGLEIAVMGPALRFACDTDDRDHRRGFRRAPGWRAGAALAGRCPCAAGSLLELGTAQGAGSRAYLAIAGGIDVPEYLGSQSTFILGRFGGHAGRVLRAGDVLHLGAVAARDSASERTATARVLATSGTSACSTARTARPISSPPKTSRCSSPRVEGALQFRPHRRAADRAEARNGRARTAAKRGCIPPTSTTTPTRSAPWISPATCRSFSDPTARASAASSAPPPSPRRAMENRPTPPRRPVRFRRVSLPSRGARSAWTVPAAVRSHAAAGDAEHPSCAARRHGLPRRWRPLPARRVRPQRARPQSALPRARAGRATARRRPARHPGHHARRTLAADSLRHAHLDRETLLDALDACERRIPDLDDISAPSRIVHLPLSWEDPATLLAIRKYMQSVRPDAPWCPSNIEFIRRINGLGFDR